MRQQCEGGVKVHVGSLAEAGLVLKSFRRSEQSVGSVHTLGALHVGHAHVIGAARKENDLVVVTVYPNKAQLAPGRIYESDLAKDVELAFDAGANVVISTTDADMYPDDYVTFLDQGGLFRRLDGARSPYLFRGMITMCVRWLNFVRPTRSYWGAKDIGQLVMLQRAVKDLLLDVEIREVPCVRYKNGAPVSSRFSKLPQHVLAEVAAMFHAIDRGRRVIRDGEKSADLVRRQIKDDLVNANLVSFELDYVAVASADTFEEIEEINFPFVLQVAIRHANFTAFDGFLIRSRRELEMGPETTWLQE